MFQIKYNKLNLFSLGLITFFFINNIIFFKPEFASDYDTHWAYLAGTTFGYTDPKWIFPNWVYGPWYYMFCSYLFGPIFFLLYKMNIIDIYYAAMYSMLFGTFILKILTLIGCYRLGKKLFNNNREISSVFACLLISIPFANKDFYEHSSETMGIMLITWCLYYLINYFRKGKKKYLLLYILFLGVGATLKMNVTIPFLIFCFTCIFFNDQKDYKNNRRNKIICLSILSLIIFILLYYFFIDNWIWENSDFRNSSRNYGEPPDLNVFLTFNFLEIWNQGVYPNLKNSFWNTVLADFFGDYFNSAYLPNGNNYSSDYILFKIRLGLIFSILFFIFLILSVSMIIIKSSLKLNKIMNFRIIFSLLFYLFLFQSICYSYVVYHKLGGSWDIRYSGIYALPLCYSLIQIMIYFKSTNYKYIINYFFISIILFSIFQRIIL